MTDEEKTQLKALAVKRSIRNGAVACGFPNEQWTSKRVRLFISERFHVEYNSNYVCEILRSLNLSPQIPQVHSVKRNQAAIDHWKRYVWPRIKKSRIEDAILILWDESVFSLSPYRRSTWASVGETPTLIEAPKERCSTGLGFLAITPRRLDLDFVHENLYEIEQRLERSEKRDCLILETLQMLIASLEAFEPYIEALQATDGLSSRSEVPGRQESVGASLIV